MTCPIRFINDNYRGNFIMTDQHKDKLKSNHTSIVNNVQFSHIVDHLIEKDVLIGDDHEVIASHRVNTDRMRCFVKDILPRRPDRAFYTFVECLMKHDIHNELVENLLRGDPRVAGLGPNHRQENQQPAPRQVMQQQVLGQQMNVDGKIRDRERYPVQASDDTRYESLDSAGMASRHPQSDMQANAGVDVVDHHATAPKNTQNSISGSQNNPRNNTGDTGIKQEDGGNAAKGCHTCNGAFREPVVLVPCGHIHCNQCAEKLKASSSEWKCTCKSSVTFSTRVYL